MIEGPGLNAIFMI